jgi:hypothetical protein
MSPVFPPRIIALSLIVGRHFAGETGLREAPDIREENEKAW